MSLKLSGKRLKSRMLRLRVRFRKKLLETTTHPTRYWTISEQIYFAPVMDKNDDNKLVEEDMKFWKHKSHFCAWLRNIWIIFIHLIDKHSMKRTWKTLFVTVTHTHIDINIKHCMIVHSEQKMKGSFRYGMMRRVGSEVKSGAAWRHFYDCIEEFKFKQWRAWGPTP